VQIRFYLNDNPDKVLTSDELEYISSKLEFGHDNRAGMNGSLHRISRVINRMDRATGVTMRIGRCMPGISELIKDLIQVSVPRGSLFGNAKDSILYCFSHFVVCMETHLVFRQSFSLVELRSHEVGRHHNRDIYASVNTGPIF
jgi:hypothetical protein